MFPYQVQLNRIEAKLDALTLKVNTMSTQITANLQALMTQVAANASVEQSAVTLIQGLATELQGAILASQNGDDQALPALVTQLNTSASALAAAVAANTPAPGTATVTTDSKKV